jgi:hypothetical protein
MTPMRRPAAQDGARRGNAVILVLMLTFALAALAASAIMLSSGARNVAKFHNTEQDLRYTADAGLTLGVSDLENNPYRLPSSGYIQLATNTPMLAADSTPVPGMTYNTWAGPTGSASRQLGRFVTVVTQANDTMHKRSFVRREEFVEETFAKFAYYSEQENGICFGSGDRLTGPIFSNSAISSCSGQKAEFMDSVETASTFTNGNPSIDTLYKPPARQNMAPINLPSTSKLVTLFTLAGTGSTLFDAGYTQNAQTDSTAKVKQRLEFVAYRVHTTDPDSTVPGSGFVRYYAVDRSGVFMNTYYTTAAKQDSAQSSYLRAGLEHRPDPKNCGDWHYVRTENPATGATGYEWEFFPAWAHGESWFQKILLLGDAENTISFPTGAAQYYPTTGSQDTTWTKVSATNSPGWQGFMNILRYGQAGHSNIPTKPGPTYTWWPAAGTQPTATCYPGGDPHLAAVERMGPIQAGLPGYVSPAAPRANSPETVTSYQWMKGGTDTTWTPAGTLGHWVIYPATIAAFTPTFKAAHPDYAYLFPTDTILNSNFKGVIAVYGSVGISGNVNGHVTVYTDGSAALIDNLRLTTSTGDTTCQHGMGIVAGQYILPADNAINLEQHVQKATAVPAAPDIYVSLRQIHGGPIANDLYVQSTVMALKSWGAESLSPDSTYDAAGLANVGGAGTSSGPAQCLGSYYVRGCVFVFGSIIQQGRVTINGCGGTQTGLSSNNYNSGWGCGYAKQYTYDQCAVVNPLPYFPTTGRYSVNKYYEDDPTKFDVAALFKALAPPP